MWLKLSLISVLIPYISSAKNKKGRDLLNIKTHQNAFLGETVYEARHQSGMPIYIVKKPGFYKKYAIFGTHYGSIDSHFITPGDKEETHEGH